MQKRKLGKKSGLEVSGDRTGLHGDELQLAFCTEEDKRR